MYLVLTIKHKKMENRDIIRLHTASIVEIEPLKDMLEENGISTLIRDQFTEGLNAGIPNGVPNSIDIYVLEKDFEKASILLAEFLK